MDFTCEENIHVSDIINVIKQDTVFSVSIVHDATSLAFP